MDRIRNARHFAPRLQRWLSEVGALIRASAPQDAGSPKKLDGQQLELFAQDFFAAIEPAARPAPTQPLFKAPPAPPRPTFPTPPRAPDAPPLPKSSLVAIHAENPAVF